MSPSSLIATRTVHYLVPSAIHWTFVWRATGGPLAVRLRQQLPLVDHQRSNNGPPDKIICHSTTVPPASVYGNGRNCVKLLPALPSPFSPSLLSPLFFPSPIFSSSVSSSSSFYFFYSSFSFSFLLLLFLLFILFYLRSFSLLPKLDIASHPLFSFNYSFLPSCPHSFRHLLSFLTFLFYPPSLLLLFFFSLSLYPYFILLYLHSFPLHYLSHISSILCIYLNPPSVSFSSSFASPFLSSSSS